MFYVKSYLILYVCNHHIYITNTYLQKLRRFEDRKPHESKLFGCKKFEGFTALFQHRRTASIFACVHD